MHPVYIVLYMRPDYDIFKMIFTGVVWNDVLLIDEVLPEATLSNHSLQVIY